MSEISNQNSSQNNEDFHKNTNETLSKNFKNHEVLLRVVTVGLFCCNCDIDSCQLSRITPVDSQVLTLYHGNEPVNITLDSGATASFITISLCRKLNLKLKPNGQMAKLGDGCTMMASLGEIDVHFTRNKWSLRLQAIVVEKLNSEVYGGMNFLKENDIQTRPLTGEIKVLNKFTVYQTNTLMSPPQLKSVKKLLLRYIYRNLAKKGLVSPHNSAL